MDIGIGLPSTIPGTPGARLIEWARRAEEAGFSSLATIDRIAYPSFESLTALAAAAGATRRIGLLTNVLLAPTRNPVQLAKEAASVDQLSGGRLTLGLAVGSREDDFDAVGLRFRDRGRRMDGDLDLMHRVWRGELVNGALKPVGPAPVRGTVPILIGGTSDAAIRRAVRWGIGWTMGGGPPERGGPLAERVRKAWAEAGREGEPRIVALTYYGLGEGAPDAAAKNLGDYYGEMGAQLAERIPKTPEALREVAIKFEDFGFDELLFDPTSPELDQVDGVAEALL